MTKPIMTEPEWVSLFIAGNMPEVYINVWNLKARIKVRRGNQEIDITDDLPDGKRLAIKAVEAAGGAITMSGLYPISDEIAAEIKELIKGA